MFQVYFEFFMMHIRPILVKKTKSKEVLSLWIAIQGGPLTPNQFSKNINNLCQMFSATLQISPISYRRMTATNIFNGSVKIPGKIVKIVLFLFILTSSFFQFRKYEFKPICGKNRNFYECYT